MNIRQAGFTLIELVVVIVILGILAAVALPRFVDFSSDARTAAISGVTGAIASSSSINYGAFKVNSARGIRLNQANICTNAIVGSLLQGGSMPTGYAVSGTGNCSTAGDGSTVSCTITDSNSPTSLTQNVAVICTN